MLEKEFVLYPEALELKNLGFDEECFGFFENGVFIYWYGSKQEPELLLNCTTPTYSQVFRWFRDKHGLYINRQPEFYTTGINFNWMIEWYLPVEEQTKHVITDSTGMYGDNNEYSTEEAMELGILQKLIEIAKQQE